MAYRIETRARDGLVAILASDEVSNEDIHRSVLDAFEAARTAGLSHVLVDIRKVAALPPTSALYDVHLELFDRQTAQSPAWATAMLVRDAQVPEMRFYGELAAHRGIAYGLFVDYGEAVAWLDTSPESPGRRAPPSASK